MGRRLGAAALNPTSSTPTPSPAPTPPPWPTPSPFPPPAPDFVALKGEWNTFSSKNGPRIDELEKRISSLFQQQNERLGYLLAASGGSNGSGASAPTPHLNGPLHGDNGHVCRSPPCSRNTETCKLNGNCCADLMFEMLVDFTRFLHEHNITYYVTAGTLLGAVR